VGFAILLFIAGCATAPPTKEVGDAEAAIAAARSAGAPKCGTEEFAAAQSNFEKGKSLAAEFCHSIEALRMLVDAKVKADEARFRCMTPESVAVVPGHNLKDIFFDFDKSDIRPDAEPVLQDNAQTLKDNPTWTVVVEGYADLRGNVAYNKGLALRRANAAKAYLVSLGIDPSRIKVVSKGESDRFGMGATSAAFQLNRRAHFLPME